MPITGTDGNDVLNGTEFNDTFDPLGGNDTVYAGGGDDLVNDGAGDDLVYGGTGHDWIYGGLGGDTLYGEDGNDNIMIVLQGGGRVYAYGGNGDDYFWILNGGGPNQAVTINAGIGNDTVQMDGFGTGNVINLGAGDDLLRWGSGNNARVTLGSGADRVMLMSNFTGGTTSVITDFTPGIDTIVFDDTNYSWLQGLRNWDGAVNPFAAGYMRLVQSGTSTILQVDPDAGGAGFSWATVITFENIAPSAFTAADFGGIAPDGSVPVGIAVTGTGGSDQLAGTMGADTIHGLDGGDRIDPGHGNDLVYAGAGDDTVLDFSGSDTVYGGIGNDTLYGGWGGDRVYGEDGNDLISISLVGGGRVYVDAGAGDDNIYVVNGGGPNQAVTLDAGTGNDSLLLHGFATGNLIDLGAGNDSLTWGSGANSIVTLGSGADAIYLDTNYEGNSNSIITDFVIGVDSFSLSNPWGSNFLSFNTSWNGSSNPFETGYLRLVSSGSDTWLQLDNNGGGDNFRTILVFQNVDANDFTAAYFGGYAPTVVTLPSQSLFGTNGNDQLIGGVGDDTLTGRGGNDSLDGGAGGDVMRGGAGDDTFHVDNGGDLAIELAGEGDDTVVSSITYRLRDHVENLTLTGSAIGAYGNSGANRIIGNTHDNIIDGGVGADIMRGGAGNDTYYVDNAGDRIAEFAGEGNDTVISSITFALRSNIENLTLTGTAVRAAGNNLVNELVGNNSNNVINGGFGADVMRGGLGNDIYYVETAGDRTIEEAGAGRDRVYTLISLTLEANVEDVFMRGSAALNATGNALDNVLRGNSGNNVLTGAGGADDLQGAGGADTFVFRDGDFAGLSPSTSDRIIDFNRGEGDIIDLGAVDANTGLGGNQAFAFLGTGTFTGAAGQLRYDVVNGNTYVTGDTNGDGVADFMIRLDGSHNLVGGDFIL